MITDELREEYEKRLGFVHNQHRDPIADMSFHFPQLRDIARDCYFIVELGVRELGSSWALLTGLADRSGTWTEPCIETGRKLNQLPLCKLVSVDHIHPSNFGGDLERFQRIASENFVSHQFVLNSSLEVEIPEVVDCIFFDTDHEYDQLKKELDRHANMSVKYLVFHDTCQSGKKIVPALNEFLEENEHWNILSHTNESCGLTVLCRFSIDNIKDMIDHQVKSREAEALRPDYNE